MSKARGSRRRTAAGEMPFIDPDRKWYVVQCKPSCDLKAGAKLRQAGVSVWAPEEAVIIVRRGRKVETLRRLFASYLFAGIGLDRNGEPDYEPMYDRTFTLGVLGGSCAAEFPVEVLQLLAERLFGMERDTTEAGQRREAAAKMAIGEFRKVLNGPFTSFMAEIMEVLDTGFVRTELTMFGRKVPVELDPHLLGAA